MSALLEILARFAGKKIVVIGDIMLDKYIRGTVERISPEAPVQVVQVQQESYAPGGAANVASNVTALGADAVLIGITGMDSTREILSSELEKRKLSAEHLIIDEKKPTIMKVRILGQNQQLLRVDYEKSSSCDAAILSKIIEAACKSINEGADAVIISDYAKGVITRAVAKEVISAGKRKGIPIIIDPKPSHVGCYENATLITPNSREADEAIRYLGHKRLEGDERGEFLMKKTSSAILITEGERGMTLYEKGTKPEHIPTSAKEVFDVTGAGDTVV